MINHKFVLEILFYTYVRENLQSLSTDLRSQRLLFRKRTLVRANCEGGIFRTFRFVSLFVNSWKNKQSRLPLAITEPSS